MAQVNGTHGSNKLDRTIFDAIPIPVFVVDDDVRVLDLNGAAAQFCVDLNSCNELKSRELINEYTGAILHCIHASDVPEGCGRGPACKSCVIRKSVADSLQGQTISRKRAQVHVTHNGKIKELQVLVTVCPMPEGNEDRALLMVEDITHLLTLKNLIPICMKCKSVREDEEYWQTLESYVHDHMGVDFSHGLCPKCVNDYYPGYRQKEPAGQQ